MPHGCGGWVGGACGRGRYCVNFRYEERLKECGLTTLETRRLREDQIEVFKICNGYENIYRNSLFFHLRKIELDDTK